METLAALYYQQVNAVCLLCLNQVWGERKVINKFVFVPVILNPNDFDYLLTRGDSQHRNYCRDSILERFDPLRGSSPTRKSVIQSPNLPATVSALSAIAENGADSVNCSYESPVTSKQLKTNLNTAVSTLTKLDSCDANSNEDYSQASSLTETFKTASSGDNVKVVSDSNVAINVGLHTKFVSFRQQGNDTMNVGLIHNTSNENMKTMEQDINEQTNLKMNAEEKVKQDR